MRFTDIILIIIMHILQDEKAPPRRIQLSSQYVGSAWWVQCPELLHAKPETTEKEQNFYHQTSQQLHGKWVSQLTSKNNEMFMSTKPQFGNHVFITNIPYRISLARFVEDIPKDDCVVVQEYVDKVRCFYDVIIARVSCTLKPRDLRDLEYWRHQ